MTNGTSPEGGRRTASFAKLSNVADAYDHAVLGYAAGRIEQVFGRIPHNCESPIEVGLLKGFIGLWLFDRSIKFDGLDGSPLETEWSARVYTQHQVGRYRVDFAIRVEASTAGKQLSAWIAVECDGHEFHEKTREQAARDKARDREITAASYRILRFTGSEIYRDCVGCARQAINLAANLVDEWLGQ